MRIMLLDDFDVCANPTFLPPPSTKAIGVVYFRKKYHTCRGRFATLKRISDVGISDVVPSTQSRIEGRNIDAVNWHSIAAQVQNMLETPGSR